MHTREGMRVKDLKRKCKTRLSIQRMNFMLGPSFHIDMIWIDWSYIICVALLKGVQISCPNLYAPLYSPPNISSHVDKKLLNTNRRLNRVNFFFPIHALKSKPPTPPKKKKNTGSHQWISLATNPYFYTPKNKITKPPPTVVHKKILSPYNIPTPTLVLEKMTPIHSLRQLFYPRLSSWPKTHQKK